MSTFIHKSRLHLLSKPRLALGLFLCSILINLYQFLYQSSNCSYLCSYKSILGKTQLTFDNSHNVPHYSEFICPQNFRNLADWVYGWPEDYLQGVSVFEQSVYTHDSKIIHWFGQNSEIYASQHGRFTPIPIGKVNALPTGNLSYF
ncbi:unnamed protein product [Adineta ricciae]|uniref:Uncharacterized protein n=1 Tax=Adineta ricciae TaxID=249248 RepID=A0A814IAW1_ADIRI|nr:unnamed protein product [Adineta ricciae]